MAATPHLSHSIAQLIPYPPTSRQAVPSYVFVYHFAAPAQASELGDLVIVIETLVNQRTGREICDLIADSVGQKYYNRDLESDLESRFESAVKVLNTQIRGFEMPKGGALGESLSGVIAVVIDDELLAARAGSANTVLCRHQKLHWIFEETGHNAPAGRTAFRELAHGQLHHGDALLVGTPAVFFQLDAAQLNSALSADSAQAVIKQLHNSLGVQQQAHRSGAVCLRFTDYNAALHQGLPSEPETIVTGEKPTVTRKASQAITPVSKSIASKGSNAAHSSWRYFTAKFLPRVKKRLMQAWQTLWIRYINKNPRLYAAIALSAVAVLLILIFVVARPHNNLKNELTAYKAANLAYLTAQSQLADGNKAAAQTSANDAQNRLAGLKDSDHKKLDAAIAKDQAITEKLSYEELSAKLGSLIDKITGTVRLDGELVYDAGAKNTELAAVAKIDSKLYLLTKSNHVIELDPATKQVKDDTTAIPASQVVAVTADTATRTLYFLTRQPGVWQYSVPNRQASQVKLSSGDWDTATDIAFYNGNLYLATPAAKQIAKHTPTSIGYGPAVPYVRQSSLNLSTIRSLAVNGNIYVGDTGGGISLFNLGLQKTFVASDTPSGLGWPQQLRLSAKNDQLAALNDRGDRIYRFALTDLGARFTSQYAVSNASHIVGFTADDSLTNWYVATPTQLVHVNTSP